MIRNVLVLGGAGFVGTQVCERLVERCPGDASVVVPTRRLRHSRHLCTLPTVECVCVDVHDEAALARMLRRIDAVINLVGVLHGDRSHFERVHAELPRRLARACRAAGVRRIVHVSALGAAPDAPSNYLRSKAAGEVALLGEPGLSVTVLRPSVMFGECDRFLNLFARLQAFLPVMPLAGHDAKFQPVWVNDVARAVVRCLDEPRSAGQIYECAGPRVYTLAELVRLAGTWSGHPRPILPLPMALGRLQALLMEILPGEPLMSRDNLDSMRVPSVASGTLPDLQALGLQPRAMEAVAPFYLARRRRAHGAFRRAA